MGRCIPCEEAEARNAKVQAADQAARLWMRKTGVQSVLLVEVLRTEGDFNKGDFTHCLPSDVRLQTIFHPVNTLIL